MLIARPHRVYLSPHFDDIAYSLGEWVNTHPGGTLVDIFTRSAYLAQGASKGLPQPEEVERISALRDAEDRMFAGAAQLERICLGAEEPRLRGRTIREIEGLPEDIEQIRGPLSGVLDAFAARGPFQLFCPAGIGGHVNHLATRAVTIEWLLAGPRQVMVCFYEDLPYAARRAQRRSGLRDLRAAIPGRLKRRAWGVTDAKLRQVRLYPSQVRQLPQNLWNFRPAAFWPPGPHEAVWVVEPTRGQGFAANSRTLP